MISRRSIVLAVTAAAATAVLIISLVSGSTTEAGSAGTGGGDEFTPATAAASSAATDPTVQQLSPFVTAVQDFSYGETGFPATRDKAQSKLWYQDGSWWAVMADPYTREVRIFELRGTAWADTGVLVDSRVQSNADVTWTGQTLYIASRTSTGDLLLQRYTYGPDRTWLPISDAPQLIAAGGGQSLTIAVDSQERVWAAWVADGSVSISHSGPGGTAFSAPVSPPGSAAENLHEDDAVAVTELTDGGVGVLWSNQTDQSFSWTSRRDADPVDTFVENQLVTKGSNVADGHINFALSPTGDLYAAVKTSLGDGGEPLESTLLEILHRAPDGTWSKTVGATVANQVTRAQLLVTADGADLVLIAASPQSGGSLYYKTSPTSEIRFPPGKGTLLLAWEGAVINNATTTRDPIDPAVPLVVLAGDSDNARYYHAELRLDGVLSSP